jgi:hypothetical protein
MAIKKKLQSAAKAKTSKKKSHLKAVPKSPVKKLKTKSASSILNKKSVKPSPKAVPKSPVKPAPLPQKVHPFARFMQNKSIHRPGAPSNQKFSPHDLYRKKAV